MRQGIEDGIAQFFPPCDYVYVKREKEALIRTKEEMPVSITILKFIPCETRKGMMFKIVPSPLAGAMVISSVKPKILLNARKYNKSVTPSVTITLSLMFI